jgi:hypothetical protein
MANSNNPHGLRPLGVCQSGGVPQLEAFTKLVGYATAIFRNDAVNRAADSGINTGGTPGTTIYSGVSMQYSPASTADTVLVMTSADAIFEAQVNGSLVEADLGLNANLLLTAGNATTKMSQHEINATGAATTNTLDVHLLRRHAILDSKNAFGTNVKLEIIFNKHRMAPGVAGV